MAASIGSRSASVCSDSSASESLCLSETSVILGGHRVSFAEFCKDGEDVGLIEELRRETVERILSAETLYAVLGVHFRDRRTDSFQELIQDAYLEMSLIVHPAECQIHGAEKAFVRLATAYDTLRDKETRLKYDKSIGLRTPREFKESQMTLFNSTELLAQALHEAVIAHDLPIRHSFLQTVSNMLLWVDGYLNPRVERRRKSSIEDEDSEKEEDDFVCRQLRDQRHHKHVEQRTTRPAPESGLLEESWRRNTPSLTPPHRQIDGDTYLGWMARKVASYDTALSSLWVLSREGVRRKKKKAKQRADQERRRSEKAAEETRREELRRRQQRMKARRQNDEESEAIPTDCGLRGVQIVEVSVEAIDQDLDYFLDIDVEVDD